MGNIAELFQRAVQYHRGGNLAQAEPLYRQVLQDDPANAEAHHLLGLLAHQAGQHDAALTLLRRAIDLNPLAAGVHFNLGIVFMNRGRTEEAAQCFHRVLQLDPNNVEAHINLGNAHLNLGRNTEAGICYRQALRLQPNHADAHINLGNTLLNQGLHAEAITSYREATRLNPRHAHAHNNLGNALMSQRQYGEADACFREAVRIDPTNARAHYNLGNLRKDQDRLAEAADCYQQALRCEPRHADALNNLGIILRGQRHLEQAAQCYREALRVHPNHADAFNNLGNVLRDQGNYDEAISSFRQALRIHPKYLDAYTNLGLVFKDQRQFPAAAECFQNAIDIDAGNTQALWNRCLLRLLQGDFPGAWPDYEQRWALPGVTPRNFSQPRWDGTFLNGKTLLVYSELGLGDTIHFARYLPLVKERGGTVIFECQPALVQAPRGAVTRGGVKALPGVDRVVAAGTPLPSFDVHFPLLSLPALLGTTLDTIPAAVPYLTADPDLVAYWRQLVNAEVTATLTPDRAPPAGQLINVGIAWQANVLHTGHDHKSFPLKCFGALAKLEKVRLISLQVGPGTEQLTSAPFPVIDLGSKFERVSLDDLAATIMTLDLVVTVDTSVAHMAGALGVPVWVPLPFVACWRWQLERSDSPWYPTMRLFRQRRPGDWEEVFGRIAADIATLVHKIA